jgi:HlyD family secretion protein
VPRAGGAGQRPGGSAGTRSKGERRSTRTVYVLKDNKPQPVQIKTGITDGIYTEVTEGLGEKDKVITSSNTRQAGGASPQPPNPFGGGMRRF